MPAYWSHTDIDYVLTYSQLDQKEETIILRSCDEEGRRLSGERDHAGHCSRSKKTRETKDVMD